jgi:hypothetical protein
MRSSVYGRLIDTSPPDEWAALWAWGSAHATATQLLPTFCLCFILPLAILIGGPLGAWALYSIMG